MNLTELKLEHSAIDEIPVESNPRPPPPTPTLHDAAMVTISRLDDHRKLTHFSEWYLNFIDNVIGRIANIHAIDGISKSRPTQ